MQGLWGWVISPVRPTDTWEHTDKLWNISSSIKLLQNILSMKKSLLSKSPKTKSIFPIIAPQFYLQNAEWKGRFYYYYWLRVFCFCITFRECSEHLVPEYFSSKRNHFLYHTWLKTVHTGFVFLWNRNHRIFSITRMRCKVAKCYKRGTQLCIEILFQPYDDILEKLPYL